MNELHEKNLISTKEASSLSGYASDYLSRLCREGKIKGTRFGRAWFIDKNSLEEFVSAQIDRKIELAESLAQQREEEYRKANSVGSESRGFAQMENSTRAAVNSIISTFTSPRFLDTKHRAPAPVFASVATALLLAASVSFVGTGYAASLGEKFATGALNTRANIIALVSSYEPEAIGSDSLAKKIDVIAIHDSAVLAASGSPVESLPSNFNELGVEALAEVNPSALTYARAEEVRSSLPTPVTAEELAAGVGYAAAHPGQTFVNLTSSAMRAYAHIGVLALSDIETAQRMHERVVYSASGALISFGSYVRDAAVTVPATIGTSYLATLESFLSSYEEAVYAFAEASQVLPNVIVSSTYAVGDSAANATASLVVTAPVAYSDSASAFAGFAGSMAEEVSGKSFAFGALSREVVGESLRLQDEFIAGSVGRTKATLASGVSGVQLLPGSIANEALGLVGNAALAIETFDTSALSATPLAALDLDRFIPGFLKNATGVLARAFESALHGVFGPLAGFFGATEEAGLAIIPTENLGGSSNEEGEGDEPSVVYNGPVTIIRNEYPTERYGGVPQSYVDERFEFLRRTLYNRIEDVADDDRFRGEITKSTIIDSDMQGGTITGTAITDSSFTGGTISGSSLNVASTTISGELVVSGDAEISGAVTASYFTATSTTDASTFPNLVATNATATNATTTNFFASALRATIATITDAFFTNITAALATLTDAVITNLTATNSTFTNATTTNATSTNLYATNAILGSATSTNLYASSARIVSGVIDTLTAPIANLTTAIITTLTATDATLTNATTTNATSTGSLALTYTTANRLLQLNAAGGVIATNLSSWIAGTANQITVTDTGSGGVSLSLPSQIIYGSSEQTTLASGGATSTFGGGLFAYALQARDYIAGPYILATSTTATSAFSGNIAVGRNTTLGTSASDALVVNANVSSNFVPSANNTYDLGSVSNGWRTIYVDEVVANNLSAASTSIAGTVSETFTINSDNGTADTEDMSIVFNRGSASPNALLTWNSTADRFEFNMPIYSASGTIANASTTALTVAGQANIGSLAGAAVSSLSQNYLAKWNNGTFINSLIYDSGSAVGIGTSTPAVSFDIFGTDALRLPTGTTAQRPTGDVGYVRYNLTTHQFEGFGDNGVWQGLGGVIDADQDTYITADTNNTDEDTLRLFTAGTERLTILPGGSIGIGTTSPGQTLSVAGTGLFSGLATFMSGFNIGSNTFTSLLGNGLINDSGTLSVSTSSLASGFFQQGGNSFGTTATLGTNDANALAFETSGSERIRITAAGLVGIGTTTPSNEFEVGDSENGSIIAMVNNLNTGTAALAAVGAKNGSNNTTALRVMAMGTNYTTAGAFVQNSGVLAAGSALSGGLSIVSGGGGIRFYTAGTADGNERIRILDNGNVGIGTTSPGQTLSVAGTGLFSGNVSVAGLTASGTVTGTNFIGTSAAATSTFAGGFASPYILADRSAAGDVSGTWFVGSNDNQATGFVISSEFSGTNHYFNKITSLASTNQSTARGRSLLIDASTGAVDTATNGTTNAAVMINARSNSGSLVSGALFGVYNNSVEQLAVLPTGARLTGSLTTTGNVGIATTSPTRLLSVGDDGTYSAFFSGRVGIGTTSPTRGLVLSSATTVNAAIQLAYTASGGRTWDLNPFRSGVSNAGFEIYDVTAGASRVAIDASGNVGVGTTSPGQTLSVAGTGLFSGLATFMSGFNIGSNTFTSLLGNGLINDSGTLSVSTSSLASGFFQQDGNSFGTTATLGTNDANALAFETSGSERIRITAAGLVGIGTTSPSQVLHTYSGAFPAFEASATGQTLYIAAPAVVGMHSELFFGTSPSVRSSSTGIARIQAVGTATGTLAGDLAFHTNAGGSLAERLRITGAGNVGIGTTTPDQKLVVAGSSAAVSIFDNSAVGVGKGGALNLQHLNTAGSAVSYASLKASAAAGTPGVEQGDLVFNTMRVGTLTEAMRVLWNGNVGIGTTSPYAKLSVAGTFANTSDLFVNDDKDSNGNVVIGAATTGISGINFNDGVNSGILRYDHSSDSMQFFTSAAERLRIASGGNVGIGTSSPAATLSVAGDSYITGNLGVGITPAFKLHVAGGARVQNSGAAAYLDVGTVDANNPYLRFFTSNTSRYVVGVDAADSNKFKIGTSNDFTTTRLTIDGSGNVGIATSTPDTNYKFNVWGNALFGTNSSANSITLQRNTASASNEVRFDSGDPANGVVRRDSSNNFGLISRGPVYFGSDHLAGGSAGDFIYQTGSATFGSGTELMRLTRTGNLGIGTTSPSYALAVAGDINATGRYRVNGTQMMYLPGGNFSGTSYYGDGGGSLSYVSGNDGRWNTGVGVGALMFNTTGSFNSALGYNALEDNTTGSTNVAMGSNALFQNTTGSNNTAVGYNALGTSLTNSSTVGIGVQAGLNVTGDSVTFVGHQSGRAASTYTNTGATGVGFQALYTGTGNYSTALGYRAGFLSTGATNLFLGYQAADNATTGANNIVIGSNIDVPSATGSNQLNIGNLIFGTGVSGTGTTIAGNIGIGTTTPGQTFSVAGTGLFSGLTTFESGFNIGSNTFTSLLGNGLTNVGGTLTVSTSSLASGFFQQGGNSFGATALLGTNDNNNLQFETNGTVAMTIDTSNNVGIGRAVPASLLHLERTDATVLDWSSIESATATNGLTIYNPTTTTGAGSFIAFRNRNSNIGVSGIYASGQGSGTSDLNFFTENANSGNVRMTITGAGNVGIGTTTPAFPLVVNATAGTNQEILRVSQNSSSRTVGIGIDDAGSNFGISLYEQGAKKFVVESNYGALIGQTYINAGTNAPANGLLVEGNVGIGSTTPSEKLVVTSGSVRLNNIVAGQGIYADNTVSNMFSFTRQNTVATGDLSITGFGGIGLTGGHTTYGSGVASGYSLYVASGGNIGIGSTTPLGKLSVQTGTSGDGIYLKSTNSASNVVFRLYNDTGTYNQMFTARSGSGTDAGKFFLSVNNGTTNAFVADTVGNIGLGTNAPATKLHLSGTTAQTLRLTNTTSLNNTGLSGIDEIGRIEFDGNRSALYRQAAFIRARQDGTWSTVNITQAPAALEFFTNGSDASVSGTTSPRMTITSAGSVGIATSSPSARLHVEVTDSTSPFIAERTGANATKFQVSVGGNNLGLIQNPFGQSWISGAVANSGYTISESNTFGTNDRFLIARTTGNVGIANSAPSFLLDVATSSSGTSNALVRLRNTNTGVNSGAGIQLDGFYAGGRIRGYTPNAGSFFGGQLDFDVNNDSNVLTTAMSITKTGNVGIGTTSPTAKFEIGDSSAGAVQQYITNSNSGTAAFGELTLRNEYSTFNGLRLITLGTGYTTSGMFQQDGAAILAGGVLSGGLSIGTGAAAPLRFYTGGTADSNERVRIDSSGNVGIGTTTPDGKLEVVTNTNSPARSFFTNTDTGTAAYTEVNIRNGAAATDSLRLLTLGTGWTTNGRFVQDGANLEASSGLLGGLSISTAASAPIRFYTSGSNERMRITETGNVGIGTTNPGALLEASTTQNASTYIRVTNASAGAAARAGIEFVNDTGSQIGHIGANGSGTAAGIGFANNLVVYGANAAGIANVAADASGVWRVLTGGTSSTNERMRITSTGNVGIGTTNPQNMFVVGGTQSGNAGLEVVPGSGIVLQSYNRTSPAYASLNLDASSIGFRPNGSAMATITTSGVAIGTATVADRLTVEVATNKRIGIEEATASAISDFSVGAAAIQFSRTADGINNLNGIFTYTSSGGRVNLALASRDDTVFATGGSGSYVNSIERMRILGSNGNVGIGVTAPTAKLEIGGTEAADEARLVFAASDASDRFTVETDLDGSTANDKLTFRAAGIDNILTLTGGGGVGIGTSSPSGALDVAGSVTSRGSHIFYGSQSNTAYALELGFDSTYQGVSNVLRFRQGGSTAGGVAFSVYDGAPNLFLTSSGTVGIGTAAAGSMLTVAGNIDTTNGADRTLTLRSSTNYAYTLIAAADDFQILEAGDPAKARLHIEYPNGNVGIGSTNPGAQLSVYRASGSSLLTDGIRVARPGSEPNYAFIAYGNGTTGAGDTAYFGSVYAGGALGQIQFRVSDGSSNIDAVRIDEAGNVGIGTTDPQALLDISSTLSGSATTTLRISGLKNDNSWTAGQAAGSIDFYNNDASGSSGAGVRSFVRSITENTNGTNWSLTFGTSLNNAAVAERLRITSAGFVGIAMTNPSVALDVTGDIEYTGTITDVSDRRLKENIQDINGALSILSGIRGTTYNMIGSDRPEVGFIAQEVQAVLPNTAKVIDPSNGYLGVSYLDFIPYLVEGVNDLNIRTLSLAPAAENREAHSLAVSADASVAGMLTVSGTGTFEDAVTAVAFLTANTSALPSEVLTAGQADLYKMGSYAITNIQSLKERADLLATRIDDVETRVAALEAQQGQATAVDGAVGLTLATLTNLLQTVGIYIENGVAQFETLVFRQLAVAKDTNGDSSAGSQTIYGGNTVAEVQNPYVLPTSKIFVTFTGPVSGAWYISHKEAGSFRVTLDQPQASDVSFDYFILQTEGQLASPGAAAPQQQTTEVPTPNPAPQPLTPVFPGTTGGAPTITLNGQAARTLSVGAPWSDPGATASDETDGDLTASIQVTGSVDTATPGVYTISYSVSDSEGNEAHVSRIVTVEASTPTPAPEPAPAPAPEPAPAPAPEPAPAPAPAPAPEPAPAPAPEPAPAPAA